MDIYYSGSEWSAAFTTAGKCFYFWRAESLSTLARGAYAQDSGHCFFFFSQFVRVF